MSASESQKDLQDEAGLWAALEKGGESWVREKLIAMYLPVAHKIASVQYKKRTSQDVEYEDFYQYAVVGLIEAVDRYNSGKGAAFETFATYRIRGAISNGLKKFTEKREQLAFRQRMIEQRVESLTGESELTVFDELVELAVGLAISYMLEGSGVCRERDSAHVETPYHRSVLSELQDKLKVAVWSVLSEKERTVVVYHYYHQMTFESIADALGVTKGRVSQIHKAALGKLENEVRTDGETFYI